MSEKRIIVGKSEQKKFSRKQLEDAGADARHLMENSSVVRQLVSTDIVLRQIFLLIRHGLENEIRQGWTVENPQLVIQTLVLAAERKACTDVPSAAVLRDSLLSNILPVLNIFCSMEEANDGKSKSTKAAAPPVHGADIVTPE